MLHHVKPVCKKKFIRKNGTCVIFIQYCHSGEKRVLLNSGISIPPQFWNLKRLKISGDLPEVYGEAEKLNGQLKDSVRLAEDILNLASKRKIDDPLAYLKRTFKPGLNLTQLAEKAELDFPKVNLDVFFQIDEYIKSKSRQVTPKMVNVYRNMRDTLRTFETFRKKKITFESFDFNFYEEFVEYMIHDHIQRRKKVIVRGFRISTVGKTIKQLRIFLRNRIRKNIIAPINLEDYKILDEEADAIYLGKEEIASIFELDLSDHLHLENYRDLFVLGCLTGLRFSDFLAMRSIDVRNGMLYKKQEKSEHWVVIPLRPEAMEIINRHFKRKDFSPSNGEFNKYIKQIGKLAGLNTQIKFSHKKGNRIIEVVKPKYDWITSHTCRRSFCTNEFLAGTPVELIMKISGHKSLRDFYKYIRITPEEAGQKIKEIWENRGEMDLKKDLIS